MISFFPNPTGPECHNSFIFTRPAIACTCQPEDSLKEEFLLLVPRDAASIMRARAKAAVDDTEHSESAFQLTREWLERCMSHSLTHPTPGGMCQGRAQWGAAGQLCASAP